MNLTPDQVRLLRLLLCGCIESSPTEDLIMLFLSRLVSRDGFMWTISQKGEAELAAIC